ncbi:MAG: response regulator transcription factor [Chloroflexi bacterium]|nr:MAG: response regulator transcription factor [Chloroflexota bacterium]
MGAPAIAATAESVSIPIRVLIAEDDPAMRSAIAELIQFTPGLELTGVAADADAAVEMATLLHPQVALLDVRMPRGGGLKAARMIREKAPAVRLVAFSAYADRSAVLEMLRAGVSEYVVKGADTDALVDALKRTGRGYIGLPAGEVAELIGDLIAVLRRLEGRATAKADLLTDAVASAEAALNDLGRRVVMHRTADLARLEEAFTIVKSVATDLRGLAASPAFEDEAVAAGDQSE